jgi:hypothetical protein
MIKHLPLATIRRDGGTQMRAEIDMLVVAEYAEAYREGADMPPLVAFHDGKDCWLGDGFHRVLGAEKAGLEKIACDLRPGSQRDAILFAAGANALHGLRRTNEDKRKAVEAVLILFDRERADKSNGEVARVCAVSELLVRTVRRELESASIISKVTIRKAYDTSNIGKSQQSSPLPGQGDLFDDEETSEAGDEPESIENEEPIPEESGPEPDDGPDDPEDDGGSDEAEDEPTDLGSSPPQPEPRPRPDRSDLIRRKFLSGLKDFDDYTRAVMAQAAHAGYGGFPAVLVTIAPQDRTFIAAQIELLIERLEEWLAYIREQAT